jgi:hypothetical protein
MHIIIVLPHIIMHGMPMLIIFIMDSQRSRIMSMVMPSMGIILQIMPSLPISMVIRHIIVIMPGIVFMLGAMPIMLGIIGIMPGIIMPIMFGIMLGIMPIMLGIMPIMFGIMPIMLGIIGIMPGIIMPIMFGIIMPGIMFGIMEPWGIELGPIGIVIAVVMAASPSFSSFRGALLGRPLYACNGPARV